MQVEVTNLCNFACTMCPAHGSRPATRTEGLMDNHTFERICRELRQLRQCFVIPQGAGESFVHPEFMSMLERLKRIGSVGIGFNTNGLLVNREIARSLIKMGIDELGFSIDAATKHEFHSITGRDCYEEVERNVLQLIEERARSGASKPKLRTLLVDTGYSDEYLQQYLAKWLPLTGEVVIQIERTDTGRKPRTTYLKDDRRRPCQHLWRTAFIQYNGEVTICCDDWNSELIVGNILNQELHSIWHGSVMARLRADHLKRNWDQTAICRDCESWVDRRISLRATDAYSLAVEPLLMRFKSKGPSK